MISMNMSPPRPSDERKLEMLPAVNARILKSWSRNIGSSDRISMKQNAVSRTTPSATEMSTVGLSHPIVCPP